MKLITRAAILSGFVGMTVGGLAAPASAAPGDIYGVDINEKLVRFSAASPGTVSVIGTLGGLAQGESVLGLDFRPADGRLYALGSANRVYTINTTTAAATLVSTLSVPVTGSVFGFDFNPVVDRLRIVSESNQNLRVDVNTGAVTVDTDVVYTGADTGTDPKVGGAAYTNNVAGAVTTELFDIDYALNAVAKQDPPNAGALTVRGTLGNNPIRLVGFDIGSDGRALAAYSEGGNPVGADELFSVDTGNGRATRLGQIGDGGGTVGPLVGIAIELLPAPPPVIPEVPYSVMLPAAAVGLLGAGVFLRRRQATQPS